MNTYLFQNTNEIVLTESTGMIVEKSNSIDTLQIIVPKIYNEIYNMAEFDALMEWKLPISHEANLAQLTLADDDYKEDYLLYTFPETTVTTAITKEPGDVQFSLTFTQADPQEDGSIIQRVRQSSGVAVIRISPITTFFTPSEAQLSKLAEIYLENKQLALALQALANQLSEEKADDIELDSLNENIYLTANGVQIGTPISLANMNQELVLTGGKLPDNGNISIQRI